MPPGLARGDAYKNQPMNNITLLEASGANLVLLGSDVFFTFDGRAATRHPVADLDAELARMVKTYYENGIRVGLVVTPHYSEYLPEGQPMPGSLPGGAAKPVPRNIRNTPALLTGYDEKVREFAALAEKYHLEMFSPMNEPDYQLGYTRASAWGQEILPSVKAAYHGKILCKPALSSGQQLDPGETVDLNLAGCDIVGVTVSPRGATVERTLAAYLGELNRTLATVGGWAKNGSVERVILGEIWFGYTTSDYSEKAKAAAIRTMFETCRGGVSGYVFYDPYPELEYAIVGTKSFDEIAYWFRSGLL
jgi:hypothetical protein